MSSSTEALVRSFRSKKRDLEKFEQKYNRDYNEFITWHNKESQRMRNDPNLHPKYKHYVQDWEKREKKYKDGWQLKNREIQKLQEKILIICGTSDANLSALEQFSNKIVARQQHSEDHSHKPGYRVRDSRYRDPGPRDPRLYKSQQNSVQEATNVYKDHSHTKNTSLDPRLERSPHNRVQYPTNAYREPRHTDHSNIDPRLKRSEQSIVQYPEVYPTDQDQTNIYSPSSPTDDSDTDPNRHTLDIRDLSAVEKFIAELKKKTNINIQRRSAVSARSSASTSSANGYLPRPIIEKVQHNLPTDESRCSSRDSGITEGKSSSSYEDAMESSSGMTPPTTSTANIPRLAHERKKNNRFAPYSTDIRNKPEDILEDVDVKELKDIIAKVTENKESDGEAEIKTKQNDKFKAQVKELNEQIQDLEKEVETIQATLYKLGQDRMDILELEKKNYPDRNTDVEITRKTQDLLDALYEKQMKFENRQSKAKTQIRRKRNLIVKVEKRLSL